LKGKREEEEPKRRGEARKARRGRERREGREGREETEERRERRGARGEEREERRESRKQSGNDSRKRCGGSIGERRDVGAERRGETQERGCEEVSQAGIAIGKRLKKVVGVMLCSFQLELIPIWISFVLLQDLWYVSYCFDIYCQL
jgi:hypothetical protein